MTGEVDSDCGVDHSNRRLTVTMDLLILLFNALPTPIALCLLCEHMEQNISANGHHEFRAAGKHATFSNGVLI